MFCITDDKGGEVVVVQLNANEWQASLPDGREVLLQATTLSEAVEQAKGAAQHDTCECGEEKYEDEQYCTLCQWDRIEAEGFDREDGTIRQEDFDFD